MTGQEWDGKGPDPWLTERLAAVADFAQAEREIRDAFWASLSGWLVETGRAVLRGDRPNPDAVWARVPAWGEAVDALLRGRIFDAIGIAFRRIFGDGYRWDQRASMVSYLAQVRNRLVRIPEEVFDLVAREVSVGVNLGESIPQLRARIDAILSTTGSERWPNRATTVARTEAIGAMNAGRAEAFRAIGEQDPDLEFERIWLATEDNRTRDTHRHADGQRQPLASPFNVGGFELMFPGDPSGPPQEVINCVPGDTMVQYPGLRAALRRRYEGEMIRIELATGDQLTITPNHPVLRADGVWTPAGEVVQGDHLVHTAAGGQFPGEPHPGHTPTQISQVESTARLMEMPDRVALSPPDLHGDAPNGDVEVVAVDLDLTLNGQAASDEQIGQLGLTLADLARLSLGSADHGAVPGRIPGGQIDLPAPGRVGVDGQGAPFIDGHPGETQVVGLTGGTDLQPQVLHPAQDGWSAGVHLPSHFQDALPTGVALAEVVKIDRYAFSGHVFNLDTGHGWYIANSIVVRNCRCTLMLVERGESVDMSNRQFKGAKKPRP